MIKQEKNLPMAQKTCLASFGPVFTVKTFQPSPYSPDTPTYHLLLEMEDGMLSISNKR